MGFFVFFCKFQFYPIPFPSDYPVFVRNKMADLSGGGFGSIKVWNLIWTLCLTRNFATLRYHLCVSATAKFVFYHMGRRLDAKC